MLYGARMEKKSFATRLYVSDIIACEDIFDRWYELMPEARRQRCDRFRISDDRKRCIGAYALLVLALRDLGIKCPDTLAIEEAQGGKPYLGDLPVFFNISHARECVVVALSPDEVGCDVEYRSDNALGVAKRFFAPDEYAYLSSIGDEDERRLQFTKIWTMKESVVKCCGEGVRRQLNDFSCTDKAGNRNRHITLAGTTDRKYHIKEYESNGGYCYSICTVNEKTEDRIRHMMLQGPGE